MKVSILGTEYEIIEQTEEQNSKLRNSNGLCEIYSHRIILNADLKEDELTYENFQEFKKRILRHEIIHAFFAESGLRGNSEYAESEELVDWIAIQLPKINKVLQQIGENCGAKMIDPQESENKQLIENEMNMCCTPLKIKESE